MFIYMYAGMHRTIEQSNTAVGERPSNSISPALPQCKSLTPIVACLGAKPASRLGHHDSTRCPSLAQHNTTTDRGGH